MKKGILIIIILNLNIMMLNASTGLLKDGSIFKCDGEYYGTHGKDVHYHKAEKSTNGNYKASGESLGTNWVCDGEIVDIDDTIVLEKQEVTFNRCVDGDTAVFNVNGKEEKFRFLAVDTPETKHPTKEVQAYGKEASDYTCDKLKNATKIEVEYEENKTDKYNRYLGWIWIDGKLLQEELISNGLAEVSYIYGNYKYTNHLCNIQTTAIKNNLGIWTTNREEGFCSSIRKLNIERTTTTTSEDETKTEESLNTQDLLYSLPILFLLFIVKKLGGKK